MYMKVMSQIFVWNDIFELFLQIIDDLVVFSRHNLFQSNWNFIPLHMSNEIGTKFQHFCLIDECWNWSDLSQFSNFVRNINFKNYWILSKLSILSNIIIFIDLLPVPFNTSEKRDQNSKKITWSIQNVPNGL